MHETKKHGDARRRFAATLDWMWPHVVELWIALVLVMFFIIRVVGSSTAQRILNALRHRAIE